MSVTVELYGLEVAGAHGVEEEERVMIAGWVMVTELTEAQLLASVTVML